MWLLPRDGVFTCRRDHDVVPLCVSRSVSSDMSLPPLALPAGLHADHILDRTDTANPLHSTTSRALLSRIVDRARQRDDPIVHHHADLRRALAECPPEFRCDVG